LLSVIQILEALSPQFFIAKDTKGKTRIVGKFMTYKKLIILGGIGSVDG